MKMKKFINAPETITDEELTGLGLAYPDILDVDGHLVISKDLADADRVTIVTYGGSGHEPAQAGFVGKGMLDVQAVGDIFAAPNDKLVFDAMKLAGQGPRRAPAHLELRRRPVGRQAGHQAGTEGRSEFPPGGDRRGDPIRPQRRRQSARAGGRRGSVPHRCRRSQRGKKPR